MASSESELTDIEKAWRPDEDGSVRRYCRAVDRDTQYACCLVPDHGLSYHVATVQSGRVICRWEELTTETALAGLREIEAELR